MKTTTYNDGVRGTLTFLETSEQIIVASLYVVEEYRNQGVASHLLGRLKAHSDKQMVPIYLRAIPSGKITLKYLLNFYRNRGFEPAAAHFGRDAMVYVPPGYERLQSIAAGCPKL